MVRSLKYVLVDVCDQPSQEEKCHKGLNNSSLHSFKVLEAAPDQPTARDSARQLSCKLYDAEFKIAQLISLTMIRLVM